MTSILRHKKIVLCLTGAAILAVAGCILFSKLFSTADRKDTAPKNNIITLKRQNLTKSISATGTVESADSRTVSARAVNLTIQKMHVRTGDSVNKGDTLLQFDKSELADALSDAKENLSTVQSDNSRNISAAAQQLSDARKNGSLENTRSSREVNRARKSLSEAKKQVAKLKKQIKAAGADKAMALREQLTKAQEAKAQALTSYENAISSKESTARQNQSSLQNAENSLENARSSARKSLREAESKLREARKNLENVVVTAPISGIVTAVYAEKGDTYSGGSLFQIDDTSSFTVSTTVDEYDISDISLGQRAVILTEATGEEEIQGKVTFIAPSTTASTAGSTTSAGNGGTSISSSSSSEGYEVQIQITDSNDKLRMGLTARCSLILTEASQVFAVPYDAIHEDSSGQSVIYAARDTDNTEKYDEIAIKKGMESDYYVEISGTELKEGMSVIIPADETEEAASGDDSGENGFGFDRQGMPEETRRRRPVTK